MGLRWASIVAIHSHLYLLNYSLLLYEGISLLSLNYELDSYIKFNVFFARWKVFDFKFSAIVLSSSIIEFALLLLLVGCLFWQLLGVLKVYLRWSFKLGLLLVVLILFSSSLSGLPMNLSLLKRDLMLWYFSWTILHFLRSISISELSLLLFLLN